MPQGFPTTASAEAPGLPPEKRAAMSPMTEKGFVETPDYAAFKACIFRKTGIDLNLYKQQQMHRRLVNMVERASARDFMEYFRAIEGDPQEMADFLDRMTINVSELFRNPEKWEEVRAQILPSLLAARRNLKIWSAGCSYGAEPYTLAILLDQLTPGARHTLHATDLDAKILAKAQAGHFTQADMKNVAPALRERYFAQQPAAGPAIAGFTSAYQVRPEVRARVAFRQHNLLADRFEAGYDLICCRNVVIYFTDEAKDRLYERFYQALAPGGILFVGGTERIFDYREIGFDTPMPFFYQRRQ